MAELRRVENGRGASAIGAGGSSRVGAILCKLTIWESAAEPVSVIIRFGVLKINSLEILTKLRQR